MTDTPAWWIRRKNEHDVDYSQRLRVRGRALQVRLEAYAEVAKALLEGPAVCDCDEGYTSRGLHEPNAVHRDYADEFARLRELSSQEGADA